MRNTKVDRLILGISNLDDLKFEQLLPYLLAFHAYVCLHIHTFFMKDRQYKHALGTRIKRNEVNVLPEA